MDHFQPKSLAFYAGAIILVVGLFGLVTTYGEANLKTAQSVEGDYRLKLPLTKGCSGGESAVLSIQQSGIYVAAALVNPDLKRSQTSFRAMTLSGQWQNQQLSLAGKVPTGLLCAGAVDNAAQTVKIEGGIAQPPATLTGTISLDAATAPLMAQRQPTQKVEEK